MTSATTKIDNNKISNNIYNILNDVTSKPTTTITPINDTIIMVVWRHQLNLTNFNKPSNMRLIVVGPSNMVINECLLVK